MCLFLTVSFVVKFTLRPRRGRNHWRGRDRLTLDSADHTDADGHDQQHRHDRDLEERDRLNLGLTYYIFKL